MRRPRRPAYPDHPSAPPPPLPPELRTVGQVVGEAVKWYRDNFFAALTLGVLPALAGIGATLLHGGAQLAFVVAASSVLMTISFVAATVLVHDLDVQRGRLLNALAAGTLVFAPATILLQIWFVPGIAWLALFGFAVPAILLEGLSGPEGIRRSVRLARAGYLHAFFSLFSLMALSALCATVLFFLLRSQGETVRAVAAFFSLVVLAPIVFIGSAYLYADLAARSVHRLGRQERAELRREHVATAPRETVPVRPGRAARPPRPGGGKARPAPAISRRQGPQGPPRRPKPE